MSIKIITRILKRFGIKMFICEKGSYCWKLQSVVMCVCMCVRVLNRINETTDFIASDKCLHYILTTYLYEFISSLCNIVNEKYQSANR